MERTVRQAMETANRVGNSQSETGEQWCLRISTGWVATLPGLAQVGWSDRAWLGDRLASQEREQVHDQGLPSRWMDCRLDQVNRSSDRLVKLFPLRSRTDTVP